MKYQSSNNRSSNSTGTPRNENATQKLIRENVDFLIEQLEAGRSDALTAYLTAMSHFHNYSFGNILQIARQKPDATHVAGLYAWNQLGRRVKKGEKGIQILAPMIGVKRKKDAEAEQDITKQNVPVLVGFRAVYVFDILQTEGKELPGMDGVKGKVGEHRDRLIAFINAQGIELEFNEHIAPAMGMSYGGKIVLLPGQSKAEEFATLVHELAHEMLHKAERRTQTTKTVRETEAEAIAFVVSKAVGLQTGTASADYIQLYHGNASLLAESLEVIQKASAVILAALETKQEVEE
jgi:antirestriction protein ArdC